MASDIRQSVLPGPALPPYKTSNSPRLQNSCCGPSCGIQVMPCASKSNKLCRAVNYYAHRLRRYSGWSPLPLGLWRWLPDWSPLHSRYLPPSMTYPWSRGDSILIRWRSWSMLGYGYARLGCGYAHPACDYAHPAHACEQAFLPMSTYAFLPRRFLPPHRNQYRRN